LGIGVRELGKKFSNAIVALDDALLKTENRVFLKWKAVLRTGPVAVDLY